MSASPQRFDFSPQITSRADRLPPDIELQEPKLLAPSEEWVQVTKQWRLYTVFGILATFVAAVVTGYGLYLLWEQVSLHDSQLAQQQLAIQQLTANGAAVSNQVGRLKTLDTNVESLKAQIELQSGRLGELEKGQSGVRDQIAGLNARWQRDIRELSKLKAAVASAPPSVPAVTNIGNPAPPPSTSSASGTLQQSAEKHNETFSPDLKPTPNSYAQMSPSGLVIWMTPRPGFSKPVPASVIGHVRGLGMLVHDWDDNNHYFITESGSWILDQR
jgi:hypothetical protein